MSTAEKGMSEVSVLAMVTVIVAGMGTSVVRAPGVVSVTDEILGTEGPGAGVDCVTVVTARVSVEDTVVVMALELVMFTLSPSVLSTSPWSLAAGGGSWLELMLEVTVVAVCVVPVSWVSQGGLEHTLCVGKGVSNEAPAWGATVGGAAPSKLDSRVLWEGALSGSRVPMLTDMVVPVEVVWCVSQGRPAGGCCPCSGWPAPPPEVAVVGVWVVPVSWVS